MYPNTFDRFDICSAYALYAHDYEMGGLARSPYNGRDILARLSRLERRFGLRWWRMPVCTDNAARIYADLVVKEGRNA